MEESLPDSYSLSKRSWYTTLLKGETGEIRCAKATVAVRGVRPADLAAITPAIQAAYESKYCVKAYNRKWLTGSASRKGSGGRWNLSRSERQSPS